MKQPYGSTRRNRTVCLIDYVNYITDSAKPIDTAELMIIFVDKNIIRGEKGMSRTAARSVTVIPPTINLLTHLSKVTMQKRRVAGYARVSTDSDEQFTSYEEQVDYYTQYIKRNPEWDFVKVYTDEGISGTNTKHRIGFNEMIADAMYGKIDLIVTKSVSRFARNTVDSLVTIRKLKEKGVEVFFEKENIYTFDGKGELLLTIMSSFAQEESRSIS